MLPLLGFELITLTAELHLVFGISETTFPASHQLYSELYSKEASLEGEEKT